MYIYFFIFTIHPSFTAKKTGTEVNTLPKSIE